MVKRVINVFVLMSILWHLVFDPLQFAFKIEYTLVFIVLDMCALFFYLVDIAFSLYLLHWMKNFDCVDYGSLRQKDRNILKSKFLTSRERQF